MRRGTSVGYSPPPPPPQPIWQDFHAAQVRAAYMRGPMSLLALELDMAVAVRLDEGRFDPDVDGELPRYLKGRDGAYLASPSVRDDPVEGHDVVGLRELVREATAQLEARLAWHRKALEGATESLRELSRRLDASESALRAVAPLREAQSGIRVRLRVPEPVEVTSLGDPVPRLLPPGPDRWEEVWIRPDELHAIAQRKYLEELRRSRVAITFPEPGLGVSWEEHSVRLAEAMKMMSTSRISMPALTRCARYDTFAGGSAGVVSE